MPPVIIISPEKPDPREPLVLAELLDAGLPRYHVRKPAWSALELEQWILFLPDWCRRHLILHQHHELVEKLGLGGIHFPDSHVGASLAGARSVDRRGFSSRSVHSLAELSASLGHFDSLFFSPVFPSISKPGYAPPPDRDESALTAALANRPKLPPTEIIALGGITPANARSCLDRGFDGVALLGTIWQSPDPVRAYLKVVRDCRAGVLHPPLSTTEAAGASHQPYRELPSVLCLTQDGLPLSHADQARQLCAAGARWIQLRMKGAPPAKWLATAREVVAICRQAGTLCVVNDSVEIALDSGADGVHLGREDGAWAEARQRLGPGRIVGGTVNNLDEARRARAADCLDYVGVGPFRFTSTKAKLSPVLGPEGIRPLLAELGDLPAWVIGGVTPADAPTIRDLGAAGLAVSSSLYRDGRVAENFRAFSSTHSNELRTTHHCRS